MRLHRSNGLTFQAAFFLAAFLTAEPERFTAHRRFIASASRFLPSGVIPPLREVFAGLAGGAVSAAFFAASAPSARGIACYLGIVRK